MGLPAFVGTTTRAGAEGPRGAHALWSKRNRSGLHEVTGACQALCIVSAAAGTGKTTFARQAMHAACAAHTPAPGGNRGRGSGIHHVAPPLFVPLFVPMQRLARLFGGEPATPLPSSPLRSMLPVASAAATDPIVRYIEAA